MCRLEVFVVADEAGFVGAFYTEEAARKAVHETYPGVPASIILWPLDGHEEPDHVWVVPARGCDLPVAVTNCRAEAVRWQAELLRIGATYEGDVDNWRAEVGSVIPAATRRLEAAAAALRTPEGGYAALAARDSEYLARFEAIEGFSPLARLIEENTHNNLLEHVITLPWTAEGGSPVTAEGGSPVAAEGGSPVAAEGGSPVAASPENG